MRFFTVEPKINHPTNKGVTKGNLYGMAMNNNGKYQLALIGYFHNEDIEIYCSHQWDEKDLIIHNEYKRNNNGVWK